MQFINGGPDIPDALLQAHEEGRVIFFCGAGISYPAGLPGFKGLVKKIYELNGTDFFEIERKAFERDQFDATLDLLERRLPGQRKDVRRALAKSLKPNLRRKGALDTHAALLRLARGREGNVRIVTTNFDRVFHAAAKRTGQRFDSYAAPMLPIPKNSRWDGIVYLHGLLPQKTDDTSLNRLVLTSGDFGLAYLTERWAARFVSELFRNYVVCFVGYSINDPVMRYMMDALAADRMLGEITPQAWALGDYERGQEHDKTIEWKAKGVAPILYEVPAGSNDHSQLHKTLQAWADTYRDGVFGKERIIVNHALAQPTASTQQDDFVGRILWALSDSSGLPAKRFAEFNPVPSLEWLLNAFAIDRFGHTDLARFNVPSHTEANPEMRFSLIRRPAPYDRAPPMLLTPSGMAAVQLDEPMWHLARWLTRHLDDPRLVLWIIDNGGHLHDRWKWFVEFQLNKIASLEVEGKDAELEEIRLHAPKAIPGPMMRILWRIILSGRAKSAWHNADLYVWTERLKREGLTASLRFQLRELLAPKVILRKPFRWGNDAENVAEPTRIHQLVDWELVLAADHVRSAINNFPKEEWAVFLPVLLPDLQQLLNDALDLLAELGSANEKNDTSTWDLPSIEQHWQNRGFHDWVSLIELLRDAWLAVLVRDSERAIRIAQDWFERPYPTFKRLALFAASRTDGITPNRWVNWLTINDAWWLWSTESVRELCRLLVLRGGDLTSTEQDLLEVAILKGPPRYMYVADLEAHEWQDILDRTIWLRLAKLKSSGITLGVAATARLADLSSAYPKWELAANESDEFSHWMSGTGDPDYEISRDVDIAPKDLAGLIKWLGKPPPDTRPFYEDTWRDLCRTNFQLSLDALQHLAEQGLWPAWRWRDALQTWSEEALVTLSWEQAASLVSAMPSDPLREVVHALTWWIEAASKSSDTHIDVMLDLCRRVMDMQLDAGKGPHIIRNGIEIYDPVSSAINHPVGHVTQALMNVWLKRNPNDNEQIPDDLESYFTELCDSEKSHYRHGRVILASRLITFYRVDSSWTQQHFLPSFDWQNPVEAKALWEGFLWSPRLYQPLLLALKPHFLESANHYGDLGEHRQQFAAFLTFAALSPLDGYSTEEFRRAIAALPQEGLERSAQALSQALESAAQHREDYWKNRIQPFWQNVWPKSRQLATPQIAESLARLAIASQSEFPNAFAAVQDWLQPVGHPDYVVRLLRESGVVTQFPLDSLQLLDRIIENQQWIGSDLGECLNQLQAALPQLTQDARFRKLQDFFRRRV